MSHPQSPSSRGRAALLFTIMIVVTAALAFAIAEMTLRAMAPPGITYHSYNYDPVTGGTLYPDSKVLYRDMDGRAIRRDVNSWGYLDIEHDSAKSAGTYRIGFFGDSYTEARQVELDETFFRLIEDKMNDGLEPGRRLPDDDGRVDQVETLAFGISGRSAVQSWLDCRQRMEDFDLNCVVYVMFDNDPRDQMKSVRRENNFPYVELDGDSLALDYSAREFFAVRDTAPRRAWQGVKARSLVLSTIDHRVKLLRQYGISPPTPMEQAPSIHPNTAPSTWWSDSLLTVAEDLHGRVIRAWREDVELAGRHFIVVYIPWEHAIRQPLAKQDSWRPWLYGLSSAHAVRLVDPSDAFLKCLDAGDTPFGDHLTPSGHEALAHVFTGYFLDR